ncbi:S1 family peptidase [Natronosporangium hydrolyticum]|uniref:S1 family peptidase n=1 Tax=Natronosporangium hydrolyticum TaxID=2811111 RepID=UPI001EFA18D1|nr:S1 family peptidase [Natronosporangium hydrolyticum]
MRRRHLVTSIAVTATAGALVAVTLPALASTDPDRSGPELDAGPGAEAAPPGIGDEIAPELLDGLRRDLGLSEAQALERLRTEAWASQTSAALREQLGERYAGAWLNEGAEDLMIGVTDAAAADQVRAAGAEPKLVDRTEQQLASAKATLDQHSDQAAAPIAGWYVSASDNALVVLTPDWAEPAAWAFVDDSGVARGGVRVEHTDEEPRLLNDIRGGDAYFINDAARCSVGFSVAGGFVTAGHCALGGAATTGFNGVPQGEFVAASFPGVGVGGPDDWGVVAVNQDWVPQPVVNDFADGTLPVAGSDEAPVGASVCKYGSTTGVSCGIIQAKDATVNYPEGTVTGMTRTDACAEPGDSGGAWLSGDQAQGITSGGSGDCTTGGVTFFQPLNEVLEINDLTLVTTDGDDIGVPPARRCRWCRLG